MKNFAKSFWSLISMPSMFLSNHFLTYCEYFHLCLKSLFGNSHISQSYLIDACMEPMYWIVDNFVVFIGPAFIVLVVTLTSFVVFISYWIGVPFYWNKSPTLTCFLIVFGNWILLNYIFHYYMGVTTSPGYPPESGLIPEAVSICKKCISPKPPRTHHCSVCNRCILKMDHHCPWLNNCVGHWNHRYFFMYMIYTVVGCTFLIIFGFEIAYKEVYLGYDAYESEDEVEGFPVHIDHSLPKEEWDLSPIHTNESLGDSVDTYSSSIDSYLPRYKCLMFMILIITGVLLALGLLSIYHAKMISRGETSIEALINKLEATRALQQGTSYTNPYNFGPRTNWWLFLGLFHGRSFWRHVLLPSPHQPLGNGLTWTSTYSPPGDGIVAHFTTCQCAEKKTI